MFNTLIRSFVTCLVLLMVSTASLSAAATEQGRHIAGKLTKVTKPAVRVLSPEERVAMKANRVSFDLSVDPNQVVCRKERVSTASRLMTRRCKTVAEFREEDERARNQWGMQMDSDRRRQATRTRGNVRRERLPVRRQ